jgi:hypothetical protein
LQYPYALDFFLSRCVFLGTTAAGAAEGGVGVDAGVDRWCREEADRVVTGSGTFGLVFFSSSFTTISIPSSEVSWITISGSAIEAEVIDADAAFFFFRELPPLLSLRLNRFSKDPA